METKSAETMSGYKAADTDKSFFGNLAGSELKQYIPVISVTIILFILGQILSPGFSSIGNIGTLLALATVLAFASCGQTLIIISGREGLDLSVGAMMSMGALVGTMFTGGQNSGVFIAVIGLIVIGAILGAVNAFGIQSLNVPPLIMTLGLASVIDGLVLALTKGQPTGSVPNNLIELGGGHAFGSVRWLFIVGAILVILVELVLRKSPYAKNLYLIGSNRRAALLSGIKVKQNIYITYAIAGVAGALGGLVLASSVGSAQMQMGNEYTLLSVAAVVIGGTQLAGGKGTFLGSALGALLILVLTSVLIAVGMPSGIRSMIQGLILMTMLIIYSREPKLRQ